MENIGALAILLALCFSAYAVLAALLGKWKNKPLVALSAERAVYVIWMLLTVASGFLIYAFMNDDFRFAYVASHSNKAMPNVFKFAAWWSGMQGSLLLWAWLLASYSAIVVYTNRRKFRDMMGYVIAILMVTQLFFLFLIAFPESPFQVLAVGKGPADIPDGQGMEPLLQYWTMVIHPPTLYLGYVGFVVPFAFAIASLITRQPGEAWIHTTRKWTIITWGFQSTGILLGAGWAYAVLGWGGYWGWDPVENASLLPWITGTAFLHSVMMQEKKGMMKVWNMVLIAATFFLCIFGTFLTRSGIVGSVHAFAQSPIGKYFVMFLAAGIAGTVYLILDRLDYLKSEAQLESVLSRESSFLFNNLLLLASCFAVLWGTIFPVISEAVTGEKITVDAPFYNRVNVPIGLSLMLLTGIGPLIAWRRSSWESLKRAFLWPTVAGVALAVGLGITGVHHPYALISFALCLFVATTIVMEFYKGAAAISAKSGSNLVLAMVELTHRNTRRYGGYIVHMGIVLMFIGFTGAAFNQDSTVEVKVGSSYHLGRYDLKVRDVLVGENDNYIWQKAQIDASVGGQQVGTLEPEQRKYKANGRGTSEVAIRRRLNEDLYLNLAAVNEAGGQRTATMQSYVFPLVSWIWLGFATLLFGTLVCLVPPKVKMQYAKTEVIGQVRKDATVTK